jgi:predicted NBD/HSP70 family sugar kinase
MYLACDIGGTNGRVTAYASRFGVDGPPEKLNTLDFGVGDFFKTDYWNLLEVCRALEAAYGPAEGVGLAVAGKVNASRTGLKAAGNLGHWVDHPVAKRLSDDLEARAVLGNDAEAASLAEAVYGLGQLDEFRGVDFMGMIWGTGVGGACVRYHDGGFVTIPAEPGHQSVGSDGRKCGCGQRNCLEAYTGGNGIRSWFGKPAEELDKHQWLTVVEKMVQGVRNTLTIQPVNLVTFSGGIACKQPWLLAAIEEELTHPMLGSPKLRVSAFGETAGTLGALSLLNL